MNTAIECDIYGNENSSHICGSKLMNGIGGSCDYERNGYISIFTTSAMVTSLSSPRRVPPRTVASLPLFRCAVTWTVPSTMWMSSLPNRELPISVAKAHCAVPKRLSKTVPIRITADLRGKGPLRRAKEIIENCAHPDYRPMLREYLKFAEKGHEPQSMRADLAMHDNFLKKGDMR